MSEILQYMKSLFLMNNDIQITLYFKYHTNTFHFSLSYFFYHIINSIIPIFYSLDVAMLNIIFGVYQTFSDTQEHCIAQNQSAK